MNHLRFLARVAGVGATAAGLGACSLIAGLSDFDGAVSAKVDSGAKKDSGPDVPVEAAVDDDAMTADDTSPSQDDGGGSADDGGGEASPEDMSYCAMARTAQTIFCKDFDDGTAATDGWSVTNFKAPSNAVFPDGGSTIASLVTSDYLSPPASSVIIVPQLTGTATGDPVYGQYTEYLQYQPQITVNFAFKCPDFDPAANITIFRLANQSSTWSVSLGFTSSGPYFLSGVAENDGGITYSSQPVDPPDLTQWTTVSLFIDIANNAATVSYNGVAAPEALTLNAPDLASTGSSLILVVGLNYTTEPVDSAFHLYFDNIDIEGAASP